MDCDNLHSSTNTVDVSEELTNRCHTTWNINNKLIKKKAEGSTPQLLKSLLFCAELEPSLNNNDIPDLSHILYHRSKLKHPEWSNEIPQCEKCPTLGHFSNF